MLSILAASHNMVIPISDGAHTEGGADGTVLCVTTLAAKGPGSLREALETDGARLVVFEVGGVIDLGGQTLSVKHPYLTIAGQTAPDPGITLIRGSLVIETHDVVVQHIAVRPGDDGPKPWAPDAISVSRGSNVVIEHCSATWAIDENLSTSGPADVEDARSTSHDITFRSCLIAQGLSHATHPKGEHSKGTLVHDGVRNVLIEGCVYAHNHERNPRLKGGTLATVRDTVMYNWSSACVGVGARGNQKMLAPAQAVLVGNVAIAGPDTKGKFFVKSVDPGGLVAMRDNLLFGVEAADDGVIISGAAAASAAGNLSAPEAGAAPQVRAERALRTAGARPAHRDPIDKRIVQSIINGTGHIIDSQNEVGGYPKREATKRALVVPKDRRAWLEKLSNELSEDRQLDVAPLWKRLKASRTASSQRAPTSVP